MNTINTLQTLRMLQLASSNLPVGGYTFSQGLEWAIDSGWLQNSAQIQSWIDEVTGITLTYTDVPLLKRQYDCIAREDWVGLERWNAQLLAMRETHELLLAELAMGEALLRLGKSLEIKLPSFCLPSETNPRPQIAYITALSLLATHQGIPLLDTCTGHAWTVIENQVLAATKLLPMGQTAAQKMLAELVVPTVDRVQEGLEIDDDNIGLSLPGLAMASAQHESQYSRLYRS